jgi:hypothetical protein
MRHIGWFATLVLFGCSNSDESRPIHDAGPVDSAPSMDMGIAADTGTTSDTGTTQDAVTASDASHDGLTGDAGGGDDGATGDAGGGNDGGGHDGGPGPDGNGTAGLDDCFEGIAPAGDNLMVIQSFETSDGTIQIRHAGEADWDRVAEACGSIVGETFPYFLMRFGFTRDGVTTCITDPAALEWCNEHHNWDERLTATDTLDEYFVRMTYNIGFWVDTLTIRDPGSTTPREGPFDLVDTGCRTIPPGDPNACQGRDRID